MASSSAGVSIAGSRRRTDAWWSIHRSRKTFFRGVGFGVDPIQFCNVTREYVGADAAQDVWEHAAAGWLRGERDNAEPVGWRDSGKLGGDQCRRRAVVGARALGRRHEMSLCRSSVRRSCTEARITRLDIRVSNRIALPSGLLMSLNFDAYNAFNSNSIRQTNESFGSSWLRPNQNSGPAHLPGSPHSWISRARIVQVGLRWGPTWMLESAPRRSCRVTPPISLPGRASRAPARAFVSSGQYARQVRRRGRGLLGR